jgi:hypothetical protein
MCSTRLPVWRFWFSSYVGNRNQSLSDDDLMICVKFFLIISWGGVRQSPLGTSATVWPIVPAPDDRWWCVEQSVEWELAAETCHSATLSTTNPACPDLGSNAGRRGGKPVTNRLSYGKAMIWHHCTMMTHPSRWLRHSLRLPWSEHAAEFTRRFTARRSIGYRHVDKLVSLKTK